MNCLTFSGINHGSNSAYSPSIKNHLRPLDNHSRTYSVINHVRMDHVESNVGTSNHSSHICGIQLSYSQYQGKD